LQIVLFSGFNRELEKGTGLPHFVDETKTVDLSPRKGGRMDMLRRAVELGLGALVITRENAEKVTNDLVKKGKMKRHESNTLMQEMIKKGKVEEKKIEVAAAKMVKETLSKLNLASKADVRRLEAEIKRLKAHKH
jgi:polyhydroxyalkanoate synthesis regulator phasin